MKRYAFFFLLLGILFSASVPVMAKSFSGMVIRVTTYDVMVKNNKGVQIFQIRPDTRGDRYPHPQDMVKVVYRVENGINIAIFIKLTKKFVL